MTAQSTAWVFTLNNYTEEEIQHLFFLFDDECTRYGIFGYEIGDNGTPHLQGYVSFSSRIRRDGAKSRLPARCWFEPAKGSPSANIVYCSKGGDFEEIGDRPTPGRRKDLEVIQEKLDEGVSSKEISTEFFGTWARNYRAISLYEHWHSPQKTPRALEDFGFTARRAPASPISRAPSEMVIPSTNLVVLSGGMDTKARRSF
jgi:Putative viral replication protein.